VRKDYDRFNYPIRNSTSDGIFNVD